MSTVNASVTRGKTFVPDANGKYEITVDGLHQGFEPTVTVAMDNTLSIGQRMISMFMAEWPGQLISDLTQMTRLPRLRFRTMRLLFDLGGKCLLN